MKTADEYSALMRSVREMDLAMERHQRRQTRKALVRILYALVLLGSIPAAGGVYALQWALPGGPGVALALYGLLGVGMAFFLTIGSLFALWKWATT